MSGYKRVNFYELCRLCATNQQKDKTHIFQEEGRKIQLQNKIQSCLSLKVCENDFLPKVVCSQCLGSLEECSAFRKECYTSETMLSSYFNNFRYTEDFKKSGKVYIKDTSPKLIAAEIPIQTPLNSITTNNNTSYNVNVVPNVTQENLPYYTLHLPSVMPTHESKPIQKDPKIVTQPQVVYNLNTIKSVNVAKTNLAEAIGNVTVNSNGEIITIAPLVDIDTLFAQSVVQKPQRKLHRKHKIIDGVDNKNLDDSVVKIDLTQPDMDLKRDAALVFDKIKMQQNRLQYTIKLDDPSKGPYVLNPMEASRTSFNPNQSVVSNPATRSLSVNRTMKSYSNFNIPTTNIITTTLSGLNPTSDVITNINPEPPPVLTPSSTVNLPISSFNSMQHYPKQDDGIASDAVALANMFSSPNTSVPTNQDACPVLKSPLSAPILGNYPSAAPNYATTTAPTTSSQTAFTGVPKQQDEVVKRHSCDICCRTFKRREHLYQHVKLHTGFRPFKCENCNKSFMRKEHLLRHMTSHSGQKNFTCSVCEKSFSRNDNLLKHKKIHSKQNSFTCEICQKQFVMEHYYLAHKHTHDSDKCNVNPVWGLLKAV